MASLPSVSPTPLDASGRLLQAESPLERLVVGNEGWKLTDSPIRVPPSKLVRTFKRTFTCMVLIAMSKMRRNLAPLTQ
ncbi:hypothetical protein TNCV_3418621 [Trichonephila clavipes]|nr:hypothetical protein TNCV_3418621 [Trichonephila clavipes]